MQIKEKSFSKILCQAEQFKIFLQTKQKKKKNREQKQLKNLSNFQNDSSSFLQINFIAKLFIT